jgi:hypothetical protein
MRHSPMVVLLAATGAVAVFAAAGVTIRPEFTPQTNLRYAWHLENENRWTPKTAAGDWSTMETDFDVVLKAANLLRNGGCEFDLKGTHLRSVAKGPKGAIGIDATPTQAKLLLGDTWLKPGPKTPLKKPMTLTVGPRFEITGATGVEPIALYLLPGVDPRIWLALTTAPKDPIVPGTDWEHDFKVPIKELGGKMLDVTVAFSVMPSSPRANRLAISMAADMDLDDFTAQVDKLGTVRIANGRLELSGEAVWNVDSGVLEKATAEQKLRLAVAKPKTVFTHRAASTMTLQR